MKSYVLLVFVMVCWTITAVAQNASPKSGHCGNGIDWSFDGRTLFLTRSDNNRSVLSNMNDYDVNKNQAPWIKQKLAVSKVIVGKGIGRIGACAFANCESLNSVEFQDTYLREIGWGAFLNCKNLFNFSIPVNIKRIETIAFANCSSLRSVKIPGLARVEDQAFFSCVNLNLIEIGNNALLGKAVFASEVEENGHKKHKPYTGEIRSLPANINTDNCLEYGLSRESVAICLKAAGSTGTNDENLSHVDKDIPESNLMRNDTYALIIGNEHYRFVSDVPFANNDATVFATYCKKTLGIPAENLHLCEDATKHMILEQEIEDWLRDGITDRKNKKLIVYYAGHGVPDIKANNKAYLLPTDVFGTKPTHGIALDDFYSLLGGLGFERVTIFIDACFSGVNRDNEGLSIERAVEVEAQDSRPTVGNMIVFTAAHGNETAQSYQEEGHGLFTYYLLKELQETHGMVSYGKLASDLEKNVSSVAPTLEMRKRQTPKTITSVTGDVWKKCTF